MSKYFVKLLLLLIAVYLILITIFTGVMYQHNKRNLLNDIHTYLERGAHLVTYLMPEGYFDRALNKDSIPEEEYNGYTKRLTNVCQISGYKFLYAVHKNDDIFYFIAGNITPEQLEKGEFEPYWLKYEQVPDALKRAYATRTIQFDQYTDEYGSFYTCFLPQKTDSGVFYITGADIEQEYFHQMLRKNTLASFLQLLALALFLLPIFIINYKIRNISLKSLRFSAALLSSAPFKCVVTDDKGNITLINNAMLAELGIDKDKGSGLNIHHPDLRAYPLFERMSFAIEKKSKWEGDFLVSSLEEQRWEYATISSASVLSAAKPVYFAFSQDVTEMRKHSEQLRQNNFILKYLTLSMHKLLSHSDPHLILQTLVSDMGNCLSLEAIVLIRKTDIHYKRIAAWYKDTICSNVSQAPLDNDAMPTLMDWESSLHAGQSVHGSAGQFPHEFLNIADIRYNVPLSVYPIRDDSRFWGFITVIRQVPETDDTSRIVENTLNTLSDSIAMAFQRYVMEDELRKATDAKSSFLSSVSHEIRTPLNGILGMITLLNTTPLSEEQKEYLSAIRTSGKQLQSLINDVLDISRIEAGKFTLHRTPVNLRSVIFVVQNIVQFQLNEKGLTLASHLEERLPDIIITDELRIKQILLNLVNNAIKFSSRGSITINADLPQPGTLEISVSDTGIGMTPEQQAKIFQPFYQIETSGAKMQGSGLGLVITRRLVLLMQGGISVSSTPGKGTTFTVSLPVTDIDSRIGP